MASTWEVRRKWKQMVKAKPKQRSANRRRQLKHNLERASLGRTKRNKGR